MSANKFSTFVMLLSLAIAPHMLAAANESIAHLNRLGTSKIGSPAAGSGTENGYEFGVGPEVDKNFTKQISGSIAPARVPADHVPMPSGNAVTVTNSGFAGFDGLTHRDQRFAGTGIYKNTQFSVEPPDQALAVGNGFVLEGVNNGLAVFDASGTVLSGPTTMSQFFGVAPEIVRPSGPFGPFISDPKAYFDSDTQRWFVTELILDENQTTGNFTGTTGVLIAVSQTPDPTGSFNIFRLDTTDNTGTPDHASCPCLGDQPLIGADANGFYISTNEFPVFHAGFNGSQVYAMSKTALAAGSLPPVVHFSGLNFAPGLPYFSVQPGTTPPGGSFETANGGTEYFLSSLDFSSTLTNQIAVWALTNTSSLNSASPNVALSTVVIDSEVYGQPPDGQQLQGPTPLATTFISQVLGGTAHPTEKLELIAGNDDRMNQVVFVNGKLWSGVNTVVKTPNGPTRVGIAYFIVTPSLSTGTLSASIASQGYVAVNQNNVLFPSIGVNAAGRGVMSFTLVGPSFFPSAAYTTIDAVGAAGDVHIASLGAGPEDGFSGYRFFGGSRTARWGDYSAAVASQDGTIWLATEYIPNKPRSVLADWGTFISNVIP